MIKIEKYGTSCTFKLYDFTACPSELHDVPIDLLDLFINYYTNGCASVWFDEEMGRQFTFTITPFYIYIIDRNVNVILYEHEIYDEIVDNFAKELIDDIESNFNECRMFSEYDPSEMIKHGDRIKRRIKKLKHLINEASKYEI